MGWALMASDDFNRADVNPITPNWTTITGESAMRLLTNQMTFSSSSGDCGAYYSGRSWIADHSSKVTMTAADGDDSGPCVCARISSSARTYYRLSVQHGPSNACVLRKFVAGVSAILDSFLQAWTNGDSWELRATGPATAAVLDMLVNGVVVRTYTDTSNTVPASGSPGVGYSSTDTSAVSDNWQGYEFTADATSAPRRESIGTRKPIVYT